MGERALKRNKLKLSVSDRAEYSAAAIDSMRKLLCFLKICKHILAVILIYIMNMKMSLYGSFESMDYALHRKDCIKMALNICFRFRTGCCHGVFIYGYGTDHVSI